MLAIAGTSASWNWQVPSDPAVAGVTFRLQGGVLLAGGTNAFGAATSNGLEAVIGVR
ncbi:MAG: hypothetical protein NXI31_04860 [bacterium]|nr:hypothetical protein [bacterium]